MERIENDTERVNLELLKELGYYDAWKRNLIAFHRRYTPVSDNNYQESMSDNLRRTWYYAMSSFGWGNTPEGSEFWTALARENFDKAKEIWNTLNA